MENIGTEIDAVRPGDGSRFGIHPYLAERLDLLEGGKHSAAADDTGAKVDQPV